MKMECKDKPLSVTPAMDSVYVKLKEGTEIIIPMRLEQNAQGCLNLIQTSTAPNVTLDFTNKTNPVSFV